MVAQDDLPGNDRASLPRLFGGATLSVCILLLSGYALSTTRLFPFALPLALAVGILCLVLLLSNAHVEVRLDEPRILVWFVLVAAILISAIFDLGVSPLKNASSLITFITCGLLITLAIPSQTFFRGYIVAMDWITSVGIAATVAVVYAGVNLPLAPVQNTNGITYLNGYAFFLIQLDDGILPKALGVFWEPGLFASFLAIACLIELCLVTRRPSRLRIGIYVLAVVLTQSTAGYLLLVFVAAIAFFKRKTAAGHLAFIVSILGGILAYSSIDKIVSLLVEYQPTVFGKLDEGGFFSETRWNAVLANWHLFTESPLVGKGVAGASESFSSSMDTLIRAQTTTSGFFIAALGVFGFSYSLAWIWGAMRLRSISIYARIWVALCLLVIVNKEPHMTMVSTYCLLFYLLSNEPNGPVAAVDQTEDRTTEFRYPKAADSGALRRSHGLG